MHHLPPIPGLIRRDPGHQYWLYDRPFAVSVTGVLRVQKTDYAMARIQATQAIWAPRGHGTHRALELFLAKRYGLPLDSDRPDRAESNEKLQALATGDYAEWIEPLITLPFWDQAHVIASERATCCIRRGVAGTYDLAYDGSRGRVLADLKTLGSPSSHTYCTRAQLGGYMALEATWGHYYDYGQTIWARPGRTTLSELYSRPECLAAWAAVWTWWQARQGI
jgi:hypothetical protein